MMGDVVYLDIPVGTGFSYGSADTDVLVDLDSISNEFVNFVDTFLKQYPEYKAPRKIILMGEDFAGKSLPRFTKALDDYTQKGGQVSLSSLVIGNPYVSGVL